MFLSWCVCNDVPSVCVCLTRSLFLTVARFSLIFRLFHSIHVFESIFHSHSTHTHDTIHIRLLNLTSLIYINLYSLHIRYIFADVASFRDAARSSRSHEKNCFFLVIVTANYAESRTRCKSHSLFMFPSTFFL